MNRHGNFTPHEHDRCIIDNPILRPRVGRVPLPPIFPPPATQSLTHHLRLLQCAAVLPRAISPHRLCHALRRFLPLHAHHPPSYDHAHPAIPKSIHAPSLPFPDSKLEDHIPKTSKAAAKHFRVCRWVCPLSYAFGNNRPNGILYWDMPIIEEMCLVGHGKPNLMLDT